ncbi:hypothetical protein SIN8267_00220 [Sinobacterium norvegicum]|uniref:Twin-arginine translocation pathway signal n=1 Tax=Sinobacterium norvegicum TaxID=1641715 RepID=A0ABM9AAX2_9GAMM|nr:hypothetical protein [Sinobacterium norvegicum]CAH0990135.1 hypothetical protein SIN8267_00220 [Sinobacterium norvegicum]
MQASIKIKAKQTADIIANCEVGEEAEKIIRPEMPPAETIGLLSDNCCFYDAVKILAHGLPKREAVWWACLATRQAHTPETNEDNINALTAAETWVQKPTEEHRLEAFDRANMTKFETPASWAATAAYWSAGSIAPQGQPDVAPPEFLYAHAVAGCIALAAVAKDEQDPDAYYKQFIAQGMDLAAGGRGNI